MNSSFSHCEHGVNFPDEISHLINDLLQMFVLQHQLVHELGMLLERGAVGVAALLFQLAAHVGEVRGAVLERDERLDVGLIHAARGVLLRLVPTHVQPLEKLVEEEEDLSEFVHNPLGRGKVI